MSPNEMLELRDVFVEPLNINYGVTIGHGHHKCTDGMEMSIEETKLLIEFLTAQVRKFEGSRCKRCNCNIKNALGDNLCAECWSKE